MNSEQTKQLDEAYDAVIEALVSVPGMKTVQAHIKDLRSERDAAIAERDERKRRQQDTTAAMSCERQMREAAEAELARVNDELLKSRIPWAQPDANRPSGRTCGECTSTWTECEPCAGPYDMNTAYKSTPSEPTPTGEPECKPCWIRGDKQDYYVVPIPVHQALVAHLRSQIAERDARIEELHKRAGYIELLLDDRIDMSDIIAELEATDETS